MPPEALRTDVQGAIDQMCESRPLDREQSLTWRVPDDPPSAPIATEVIHVGFGSHHVVVTIGVAAN